MIVTKMKRLATALLVLAVILPPVAATAESPTLLREKWLDLADAVQAANDAAMTAAADPLTAPMVVCEQRGCTAAAPQQLSPEEGARLRALFASLADAPGERARIGRAIALMEGFMGGRNGTWRDHAANERLSEDEPGQLDCVAESINTRTYLDRLAGAGLLRHHVRGDFIHRYTVVLQHVAVDIVPDDGEDHFAVDSWVGANGEEPQIIPYDDWRWEWGV